MNNKIVVVGLGYVGCSLAVLLAESNEVLAIDIDEKKIDLLNKKKSPIVDQEISSFLEKKKINLSASSSLDESIDDANILIISTPTDFDEQRNSFDTSSIEGVLEVLDKRRFSGTIVIKSTVPIGFTDLMSKKYKQLKVIFSPEFLREGKALYDNLYPSRIVVGGNKALCSKFSLILKGSARKKDVHIFQMTSSEAEAVKLFSNAYLAMRVSYFNEVDTFSILKELNSKNIIEGISADPRIGNHYNNPSFGYGGYCLPKDTKQLKVNFVDIPQNLISSIIKSNDTRKSFLSEFIIKMEVETVGFYRLVMKKGSDNFRESSVRDLLANVVQSGKDIIIYEQFLSDELKEFPRIRIMKDLERFKSESEVIIANRLSKELVDVEEKVFSRDIFNTN